MATEEHDHEVKIKGGSFDLSDLGHLLPGMAEIMPLVGGRIWKCYYAGKAHNKVLANFQLSEAVNLMEKGAILRPKYSDDMDKFIAGIVADLRKSIETEDWDAFERWWAKSVKRADGKYEVSFEVEAKKLYADGKGKETEAPLDEPFDIGAFTAEPGKKGYTNDAVLLTERRPMKSGKQQVTLVVDKPPKVVGVDPFNKRIDRNSDDNLAKVELEG